MKTPSIGAVSNLAADSGMDRSAPFVGSCAEAAVDCVDHPAETGKTSPVEIDYQPGKMRKIRFIVFFGKRPCLLDRTARDEKI